VRLIPPPGTEQGGVDQWNRHIPWLKPGGGGGQENRDPSSRWPYYKCNVKVFLLVSWIALVWTIPTGSVLKTLVGFCYVVPACMLGWF
jgi:hypothetical protein